MSVLHLMNHVATVTRRTPAGVDKYGNTTHTTQISGPHPCRIEQMSSKEHDVDRATVVTAFRGFFMPQAALTAGDVINANGKTYQVDGDPMVRDGMRSAHHIEASLKEVRA